MKGYDLMKEVTENTGKHEGKTFDVVAGNVITYNGVDVRRVCVLNGEIVSVAGILNSQLKLYFSKTAVLKQVRESVDFMTAAKAYSKGKNIRCKWGNSCTSIYNHSLQVKNDIDFSTRLGYIRIEEILSGTWYIDD